MEPATVKPQPAPCCSEESASHDERSLTIERDVMRTLSQHPRFGGRTNTITIECRHDMLIINGRLPSFYLKQLLQESLRRVEGVGQIDNRVDVVCSDGVSSTNRK